jgi:diguanylate cyclase (GGDEF)-like protein
MFNTVDSLLSSMSTTRLLGVCTLAVALIGVTDYATGYELSFSVFYTAPVAAASWYGNRRAGLPVALVSAIVWLTADWASGNSYSSMLVPFWNVTVKLSFFVIVSELLCGLQLLLGREREMARMDALTSALNTRAFTESARTLFELARRYGHSTVLGYVDIDNFKGVNDQYGHAEGDQGLRSVSEMLMRSVRHTDVVGRLGGEEFAVLLPETSRAGAEELFGRIRTRLLEKARDSAWPITPSIGVAVFRVPPPSAEEALKVADSLMYRVKNTGKNSILTEEFPASVAEPMPPSEDAALYRLSPD